MSTPIADAQGRGQDDSDFDPRDIVTSHAFQVDEALLGFVQLYWDPNRQAIHDRVARTVVIRTRSAGETGDVGYS